MYKLGTWLVTGTMHKRFSLKREWLQIILIALIMRLLFTFMGVFTLWDATPLPPPWMVDYFPRVERFTDSAASPSLGEKLLVNNWYRWDTGYFVKIGMAGYEIDDGSMSYMPLYPLLIRLTHLLTGQNGLVSALLVSNLLCILALILFYEIALLELGSPDLAWQAFLFLITFPATFFLFAAYAESLFLALILATWLFIRLNNWPLAALSSSLAVLTRLQGLALVFPLGWQALVSIQASRPLPPGQEIRSVLHFYILEHGWRRLFTSQAASAWAAALFPALTLLLYNTGTGIVGLNSVVSAYSSRNSPTAFPWQGFTEFLGRIFTIRYLPSDYIDLVLIILFGFVMAISIKKIPPALWFYSLVVLVMIFSRSYGANLLSGFMRFMLTTFPFFIGLAMLGLNQRIRNIILFLFVFSQLFLLWMFFLWIWVA